MPERGDFASWAAEGWSEFVPGHDPRLAELAVRFARTGRLLTAAQTEGLRRYRSQGVAGLEDFRALALLRRSSAPGLQVREMAELLRVEKGTVSNRVERLFQEGLVVRNDNPRDRRSHWVDLTPEGVALVDEMYGALSGIHERFFAGLSDEGVDALGGLLVDVLEPMEGDGVQTPENG